MSDEPSFHHFNVQHYCPLALALEQLGDRWSFLIIRDLMHGPQRFSDLQRLIAGITPRRLTTQLRALEATGIVEREQLQGRREVRYCLTEKGQGLVPAIRSLAVWGLEHLTRPPLPGEMINPENVMDIFTAALNQQGFRLVQPVTWTVRFAEKKVFTITFDGEQWTLETAAITHATLTIDTTPEIWMEFLLSPVEERQRFLDSMHIGGDQIHINELLSLHWRDQPVSIESL